MQQRECGVWSVCMTVRLFMCIYIRRMRNVNRTSGWWRRRRRQRCTVEPGRVYTAAWWQIYTRLILFSFFMAPCILALENVAWFNFGKKNTAFYIFALLEVPFKIERKKNNVLLFTSTDTNDKCAFWTMSCGSLFHGVGARLDMYIYVCLCVYA